ncbi:MAG: phenylalanine--tRNA ligase subunit beta, partial [Calditrichia bacterium]
MKISYNWLQDYVDLKTKPQDLANQLSLSGLEVEEIIKKTLDYPGVVVGRVLSVEEHPNADKLKICKVDTGKKQSSIICGAPNVAKGQTVPVALVGAVLPTGLKIKKVKIRDVLSEGMICSEAELGLSDKSEGIWVLDNSLKIGEPLQKALQIKSDYIFDLAVTPNRPDCLSHIGIAREVAALTQQKLRRPKVQLNEAKESAFSQIKIQIETPKGCPRYSARVLKNVTVGDSPQWLVERLEGVGLRSINNIVDVTNYVLMETGHPLHAFDLGLIEGKKIIVRESGDGEKFTTLDDQERSLKKGTVLICDAQKQVNLETTNILLESAYFQPESIQISARYLGLSTEASQRFERGADPNGNIYALDRAAQLIREVAGGEIQNGVVDAYPTKIHSRKIPLELAKINNLLGTQFSKTQVKKILESIELHVENEMVLIPTFRPDLSTSTDLAEEVARLYGLDNIEASDKVKIDYDIHFNELDIFIDNLKDILTGFGLQEIITGSMINSEVWEKLTGEKIYPVLNPISKDMDGLRNSLIPSMAMTLQYNRNRQIKNLKLFE